MHFVVCRLFFRLLSLTASRKSPHIKTVDIRKVVQSAVAVFSASVRIRSVKIDIQPHPSSENAFYTFYLPYINVEMPHTPPTIPKTHLYVAFMSLCKIPPQKTGLGKTGGEKMRKHKTHTKARNAIAIEA
jgi:hypothetical protein